MSITNLAVVDRIPPQNLEAEMALIGSVLVDREIMGIVCEIVRPNEFYAHVHESIFAVLQHLYDRGEPLDKITVAEELKRRGELENVGGLSYLSALMDTVQTAASAAYYAKIVREKAVLRGLIHAGTRITQLGYENEEDVDGALDQSEQLVYELGNRQLHGEFTPVSRLLKPAFEHIDKLFHNRGGRTGLTAGFHDIDEMTTGFQPGNFIILAARPGMGKTSFALNMAVAAAREEPAPIAFFSLEMSNDELVQRLICAEARISMHDMRRGHIKNEHWEKISDAMGELNELAIYLDDAGGLSISEIRSRCRRLKSAHGLSAVFIDYLQLLRPSVLSKGANRNEELSEICRTLKTTAKDLQVPIVALAQLNRGVEARTDKRPMLSDLRDCLSGDALVLNADTGERVRIADIVDGRLRFNVWAVDERLKLVRRPITDAWAVGEKQLFKVTTRSGRVIRCTDGHRFLTILGWATLRELNAGNQIAVPRGYVAPAWQGTAMTPGAALLLGWLIGDGWLGGSAALTVATREEADLSAAPARDEFGLRPVIKPEHAGKNPLTTWLRELGIWNKTGSGKSVPKPVYLQSEEVIAAFLRGLFHADGSLSRKSQKSSIVVRLSTLSERLAMDVQHLLMRLGINAFVASDTRNIGGYRTKTDRIWTVRITDRSSVVTFIERVGFLGKKHAAAVGKVEPIKQNDAGHFDRLPRIVNELVGELRRGSHYSHASLGWRGQGKTMSRATCAALAERLDDEELATLAYSDVLWDEIASVEPIGTDTAYDLTVGDLHNFCVDDFITHNSGSLEQEADMVAFLFREGYYHNEVAEPDLTEFIVAKHRNGPTGTVKLRFQREYTLFQPYADVSHYPAP
jgi:replicative DNA helicase